MKRLVIISVMLTLAGNGSAQLISRFEARTFMNGNFTLPYRIIYPKNFDSAKRYPLILFLHGAGERGNDNAKQLTHGAALFAADSTMDRFPAIVVFPQCPTDSFWANVSVVTNPDGSRSFTFPSKGKPTPPMAAVIALMDSLVSNANVDKGRVYMGGLSMGGMGTFELMARRPKMFAAAFPICGGGSPKNVNRYAKRVKLWVFHGEADNVVPLIHSQEMVGAIKKAKGDVRFSVYPGVGHNSWDNAFAERDLLPWLFSVIRE